jgi:hypothetical protein
LDPERVFLFQARSKRRARLEGQYCMGRFTEIFHCIACGSVDKYLIRARASALLGLAH